MTQQSFENRLFYGMWALACICALAATALRTSYGESILLLPIIAGSAFGIVAAIVLHKRRVGLAKSDGSINDLEMLQLQARKEGLQAYLAVSVFIRPASNNDSSSTDAIKMAGISEQPRGESLTLVHS